MAVTLQRVLSDDELHRRVRPPLVLAGRCMSGWVVSVISAGLRLGLVAMRTRRKHWARSSKICWLPQGV